MVDLTIPSKTDYLSIVNKVAEEFTEHAGLDEDDRNAVATAVIEAATNAIQHGNRNDATKKVRLQFVLSPDRLEVTVKDEGRGFDPAEVEDPLKPENMLRERGRGIFIIRAFMDDVKFTASSRGGMTVRLVKHINRSSAREQAGL